MACSRGGTSEDELELVRAGLPREIAGWRAVDDDQMYDQESIFSYIDGQAEVYLAYGMTRCLARRYSGPEGQPDIVVDIFELASPADAYGVFTHDRDGDNLDIGQGALLRPGWLSFWKGSFFGSIYAEGESDASAAAVEELARAAADAVPSEGETPALVGLLPPEGLEKRSVRYLHRWEILNSALYVGADNVFGLNSETNAALGKYRRGEGEAWLLLIEYADEAQAKAAEQRARTAGFAVRRQGRSLAAVLQPTEPAVSEELLADAFGGVE
jgi:hypothetical protein